MSTITLPTTGTTTFPAAARTAGRRLEPARPFNADDLAFAVAADGVAAHEAEVGALVRSASERGVTTAALGVLADSAAPAVARERAFGLVAATLARVGTASPPGLLSPAA